MKKSKRSKANHYFGRMRKAREGKDFNPTIKKKRTKQPKSGPVITFEEFDELIGDGNKTVKSNDKSQTVVQQSEE